MGYVENCEASWGEVFCQDFITHVRVGTNGDNEGVDNVMEVIMAYN